MIVNFSSLWGLTLLVILMNVNSFDLEENILEGHFTELGELIFGTPSDETGKKVAEWNPKMDVNPEELGEYLEGDILFPISKGRNGMKAESSRWPGGVVPYEISPYFSSTDRSTILSAMEDYHKHTCIKFVPRTGSERDYIRIVGGNTGCWSSVGRVGGYQDVNLQSPGCLTKKGTAIHELMHALGFYHEHTRWERDSHVTINWPNIQRGVENNFQKASKKSTSGYGVDYDYRSVMHYSAYAFSANGKPTIDPKVSGMTLGQRDGFSKGDIKKINRMYKCKGSGSGGSTGSGSASGSGGSSNCFLGFCP